MDTTYLSILRQKQFEWDIKSLIIRLYGLNNGKSRINLGKRPGIGEEVHLFDLTIPNTPQT